jgi:hypothetical protein
MSVRVRQLQHFVDQLACHFARVPRARRRAGWSDAQKIERRELVGALASIVRFDVLGTFWTNERAAFVAVKPENEGCGAGDVAA